MGKAILITVAVLIGYYMFFPMDRQYIEVDGDRKRVASIYSSDLYEPLTTRTRDFFYRCLDVNADDDSIPSASCVAAMNTANFEWPEIMHDPDCEIVRPGARLKAFDEDGNYLPIKDFFGQMKCEPEYLGTMPILQSEMLEEEGIFVRADVARFAPHEAGEFHIYRYSSGYNTRYAAAVGVGTKRKLVKLTMIGDDERAERELNPVVLTVNDSRFTDAVIALGRANARDCGHFVLYSNGVAQCDSSRWKIRFVSQSAVCTASC